ncbi:hypothetical protein TELCIR_10153 [Teladorsagia circumcincta]|uniref:Uncharacterized protein n=1 Tax=Teladorsagia circumcincta TaxID=45464 RepID=A0A2G9UCV4_TELCI|nr:hypothetical protein TELCIR_10153 [Teladorsagia circumcincta]
MRDLGRYMVVNPVVTPSSSTADLKELVERSDNAKLDTPSTDVGMPAHSTRDPAHVNGSSQRMKESERSRASSTPARPPLPPRGFSTTSSQEPLQSGNPQSPPLPLAALVQGPPKFPPPERRPPPVPPRPSVPPRTHHKEESAQQENVESHGKEPPNALPLWTSEPQKVLATPIEPVRHYIYQDLICLFASYLSQVHM